MILAKNNQWVICTPSKTGSSSLEATLIKRYKVGRYIFQENPYYHPKKYQHGALYNGKAKDRILIVRHPLERWSSIYWYSFKRPSMFLHKHAKDANEFCEAWFKSREESKYKYFNMSLLDYHKIFKPTITFKQENGFEDLMEFLKLEKDVSQSNINAENFGWEHTEQFLTLKNIDRLKDLYKPDAKLFNYKL